MPLRLSRHVREATERRHLCLAGLLEEQSALVRQVI
jgi:hypothetical protein